MSPRRRSKAPNVFLSHSSADESTTRKLAAVLRAHGVRVWYSEKHIRAASQWHDEIGKALKQSDWLCVLLTPDSVKSKWVKHEVLYALQEDRYEGHVVPILLKSCDIDALSWVLSSLQMIKASRRFDAACRELLALWGIQYRPAKR